MQQAVPKLIMNFHPTHEKEASPALQLLSQGRLPPLRW